MQAMDATIINKLISIVIIKTFTIYLNINQDDSFGHKLVDIGSRSLQMTSREKKNIRNIFITGIFAKRNFKYIEHCTS